MTLRVSKSFPIDTVVKIAVILAATLTIIIAFSTTRIKAEPGEVSWIPGDPTYTAEVAPVGIMQTNCTHENVLVGSYASTTEDICIYWGSGFKYGVSRQTINNSMVESFVIGFPNETRMYKVQNGPTNWFVSTPDSKDLFLKLGGVHPFVIHDILSKLQRVTNADFSTSYTIAPQSHEPLLKDQDGNSAGLRSGGVSKNGKWAVAEISRAGFVRINTETGVVRWFSNYTHTYGVGMDAQAEYAISNDGRFIAIVGNNVHHQLVSLETSCGTDNLTYFNTAWLKEDLTNPCPAIELYWPVSDAIGGDLQSLGIASFNHDGGELTVHASPYFRQGVEHKNYWVTINAPGYVAPRLDYLALGDSYSSGEGDTEIDPISNWKYYRNHTDEEEDRVANQPREKCHLSTRSYPYLIARWMDLALDVPKQWDSVACSGAQIWDMKEQASSQYEGQDKRLLGYNQESFKIQALNEMIPGRHKQIEFVKKYKPKTITLTMGGNDVGFGGKLSDCATSSDTCQFAEFAWRSRLKVELQSQYEELESLYDELIQASNRESKIYVLGYPQFIDGSVNSLCDNTYNLDLDEREMIVNSVAYLNNVIEQAARASGVKYVDIEDALGDHKLCDSGEKHVTAITNIFGINRNDQQESFHPNAKGHIDISNSIKNKLNNQSLLTYDYCTGIASLVCPDNAAVENTIPIPEYFSVISSEDDNKFVHYQLSDGTFIKGEQGVVSVLPYTYYANGPLDATIYSEPTSLGLITANSDGSMDTTISIPPTLQAGYHVLVLTGKTYSGEPMEMYQTVLIKGSDPNDIDENGMLDSQQPCGPFLTASGLDIDNDEIDDACDPIIDPPKAPYRLRAGDPSRQYNGVPEVANYLYLERNIYATAKTGVTGDYDPDHDGYAIVATTVATSPAGTNLLTSTTGQLARYQEDTTSIPNTITLSFRTKENGCVSFKPTDLSQVTSTTTPSTRTFTQVATDTNTCREQSPTADLDNNGQPDNTQPLYRARNGDLTKGENPKKLYLERSTRAAESQLNKSDYAPNKPTAPTTISPTDTTDYRADWSLIASTQSAPVTPLTYKKVHMAGTQPYVLARVGILGLCQAYKPQNLGTIKQSMQNGTNLTLDVTKTLHVQLWGGCND